jgi:NADH oxidase (H2O2-forming)
MIRCGIPYIYGTLRDTNKNVIPDAMLSDSNINLIIDHVTSINREAKTVTTESGEVYSYKKLIIATGSLPIIPIFIPIMISKTCYL